MSKSSKQPRTYPHEWIAKAEWRSTALKFRVEGRNESHAWHRAWGTVSRMEGGSDCLKVTLLNQIK